MSVCRLCRMDHEFTPEGRCVPATKIVAGAMRAIRKAVNEGDIGAPAIALMSAKTYSALKPLGRKPKKERVRAYRTRKRAQV